MRPQNHDLDDEIRGHLAIAINERIERGESPEAARLAALRELGYVPAIRDSMRRVWYSRWVDAGAALGQDIRVGLRSLLRAKGLSATVVVTLALGIGANAAIFSVVREVLLRPLVNRDADRLLYIRQSAPGLAADNLTFSVPEIDDFKSRVTTISAFGDFSTIEFTMIGFGEPRVVQAGVVSGSYFDVMGLRPILGRLITAADDGRDAEGVAVLTHRFWSTALNRDPSVIGRTVRLGTRAATVIGVLEPSVPYPAETEIIANVVTSPHHLGATMVTLRTHRMTELFGRLAPGATIDAARAELEAVHAGMMREHPAAYSAAAQTTLTATPLSDQIAAPARTILIVLLAAAALVFVIACSNVANLILARSVRREGELAVRAALGASRAALRRTLLGESLVLCGAGAILGVLLAGPLVAVVSRYAARFSVRAHDVAVDAGVLWVGAGLAIMAAIVLAYVPRLPASHASPRRKWRTWASARPSEKRAQASAPAGLLGSAGIRITPSTNRRLRVFAVTQVALSFVLLAGAGMLLTTLVALQRTSTGYDMHQVLAIDVPTPLEVMGPKAVAFFDEAARRIRELPRVRRVALGNVVPWRDAGRFGPGMSFAVEGYTPADGEEHPRARLRNVTPGFFATLGVPLLAGRDFTDDDRGGSELVVVVSQTLAQRLFPNGEALNRRFWWTEEYFGKPVPRRIIGVVADVDDENVVPGPALTVYHPFRQVSFANRLFVHTAGDPYALVAPVTRIIREMSAEQPVERAATLADVRAEVLAPERLNAFVLSGFGGVALLIAVVGVAGVLAFTVSARTREFGVRLAVGSKPRDLLLHILSQGALIVTIGIIAGVAGGYAFGLVAASYFGDVHLPGAVPVLGAAAVLAGAGILASLMPAARAARVDVLQALRSE
jgi:putative ABC transport system permease protein